MIKKVLRARVTNDEITGYGKDKKLYIANKVIALNADKKDKTSFFIAKYKDLMYKVSDDVYMSLSDFCHFELLIDKYQLDINFSDKEKILFIETDGISTLVHSEDLSTVSEDAVYAANLERLADYDATYENIKYFEDYVFLINFINRFNRPFIKRNFKDSSINPETVKKEYVIANQNDLEDYIKLLNHENETNTPLRKIYQNRLF